MRSFSPSHTHTRTHTHTQTLMHELELCVKIHTKVNTEWTEDTSTQHSHAKLCVFLQYHAGASLFYRHTHRHTHTNDSTIQLHNILPLYSAVSRLNYSRAEWISKREDKRPSSFWNRFNMFVLFSAHLWAGSVSEKYEVIMFRLMERIISCILFHPANHSNTSVLTSWSESLVSAFHFPFLFLSFFHFLVIPDVHSAKHEINTAI